MAGYIGTTPVPQATQHRESFTATGGQTSFATAGYTPQFIDVYLNGVKLAPADYTATNGSDVVLASGATASDILEIVAYTPFEVANQTFTGDTSVTNLAVTGTFTSRGIDDNADAVAITIDSSENVGIGTSSPSAPLHINGGSANVVLKATNSSNTTGLFVGARDGVFGSIFSAGDGYIYQGNGKNLSMTADGGGVVRFGTGSTERMRLTSAGDLLVGKTPINYQSAGFQAASNGVTGATASATSPFFVNRITDDGELSTFYRSGTKVGSIGTDATDIYIGTGDTGIRFNDAVNGVLPYNTSTGQTDATLDLGFSTVRWKDLYLSGQVVNPSGDLTLGSTSASHDTFLSSARNTRFYTSGSERMRIDSSGNLLVGTTSAYGVGGATLTAGGLIYSSVSGDKAAEFNRATSDGDIVKFNKDGSTVGSIGSYNSGSNLYVNSLGTALSLRVANGDMLTLTNGNLYPTTDSGVNLGLSNRHFNNLHLSGGVIFSDAGSSGTSSSNELNSYEEGTWTPQLLINNSSSGIVYNGRDGSYTKVGRLVTLMGYIHLSSKGTTAGGVSIAGLPFTTGDSLGTTSFNGTGTFWFDNMASAKSNLICWVDDLNTEMYLRHTAGSGSTVYQNTAASDITNTFDIRFVVHYFTS